MISTQQDFEEGTAFELYVLETVRPAIEQHGGASIDLRGSKTVAEVAKELGVSQSMLHRWRARFASELPSSAQASQGEREEVERLRRELRDLQAENSLLKKAAALFAKDVK